LSFPPSLHTLRPPPISTLFPYTTLFRSHSEPESRARAPVHRRESAPSTYRGAHSNPTCPALANLWALALWPGPASPGCRRSPCRSEEHTSELQSRENLVCRLLLEKKKKK